MQVALLGRVRPFVLSTVYRYIMCIKVACLLMVLSASLPQAAAADSLGLRFAEVSVGAKSGEANAHLFADFALTDAHGLQLDLGVLGSANSYLGQIDAHVYMMPTEAAKYGLFVSLADMNGREATIGTLGVEAMFALSSRTEVHGRAGFGMARSDIVGTVDFVTATLGASHALSDVVAVFGDVTVSEFDEASLRAVASAVTLGVRYQPDGQPWELAASVVRDGLTGRDAAAFDMRAQVAFTWHLGAGGGAKRGLSARGFASPQAFDPLLRRGMF